MPGEMDLDQILLKLSPVLLEESYAFCALPDHKYGDLAELSPLAAVQEPEGLTLVLRAQDAQRENLIFHGLFRCIRLEVHSSLESVGLTARLSTALAEQGISANLIAGAHHDHVLVPEQSALHALEILQNLSTTASHLR
jgi:hypothetical protein